MTDDTVADEPTDGEPTDSEPTPPDANATRPRPTGSRRAGADGDVVAESSPADLDLPRHASDDGNGSFE